MRAYPNSVLFTGAKSGDILKGCGDKNCGLRIKVESPQHVGNGGRVKGRFQLVSAGTGEYSDSLKEYEGMTVSDVKHLINEVAAKGQTACRHIFNMNMMALE